MTRTLSNFILFVLLAAVFLAAIVANNTLLRGVNFDLTDDKIYSLSEGSQAVASSLDEPITLYFFFSNNASTGMTSIRDYAARVESLLQEYVRLSDGRIRLEVIDPEPFSENEDRAASFGLTAASAGLNQDNIYFGLAGTNSVDDTVVISFFDPQKEAFLEYDISSLLHKLSTPDIIKLTIVSDLQLSGGQNPLTGQMTPAFVLYQQLQEFFEIELVSSSAETLPADTKLLMLWHPQNISEPLLRSIDAFIINGGKTLALLDPHYESDPMSQMGSVGADASMLPMLETYGVQFSNATIVLDSLTGLEVRASQTEIIRHMGFLGLGAGQINVEDITSGDLEVINGASFGYLALSANSELSEEVLLSSSNNTSLISNEVYAGTADVKSLAESFANSNTSYTLAARYSGLARPYYSGDAIDKEINEQDDELPEQAPLESPVNATAQNQLSEAKSEINLVVIADADIAADRFWVQQSSFFGQTVFSPFANNGDFIINILENFGGNENLIGIRSRGTFARPFTRVQSIQLAAEEKFREQEKRLQAQLEQTELQLSELQTQGDSLILSSEQEAAIEQFTEQRINIRKSLRDVQFQLDKDIDELGNILKIINIAVAPAILVVLLYLLAMLMRSKAPKTIKVVKAKKQRAEPSISFELDGENDTKTQSTPTEDLSSNEDEIKKQIEVDAKIDEEHKDKKGD